MGVLDPLQAAGWERGGSREASAQLTASLALHYAVQGTLAICYTTEGSPFTRLAWCIAEIPLNRGKDGMKAWIESPRVEKNKDERKTGHRGQRMSAADVLYHGDITHAHKHAG